MSGNVALDVVIGLVFVYLLYSLYATVMMEIISSFLGLRSRNLSYTLRRMLMDERRYPQVTIPLLGKDFVVNPQEWLARGVTSFIQLWGWEINLKNNTLYRKFMNQPSIKSLGSGGISRRPSYLTAGTFSAALMDVLQDRDDDDSGVLVRIQAGLRALPEDSDTRKQLESMLRTANQDLVKFNLLLERWFDETMERCIGWYKRSVQIILILVGGFLVVSFNVDTLAIFKKLSNDPAAREQLVNSAIEFQKNNEGLIRMILAKADTTQADSVIVKRLDSLRHVQQMLHDDIAKSQSILNQDWHLPDTLEARAVEPTEEELKKLKAQSIAYTLPDNTQVFVIADVTLDREILRSSLADCLQPGRGYLAVRTWHYKFCYARKHCWGYLLTILAISLGSPFWFDLLNKLVKLRTSKTVPTDSDSGVAASESTQAKAETLTRVG